MNKQFDVVLAKLDPAIGSEIKKTRPVIIISPDEMNESLRTVLVAPLTSKGFWRPFRPSITFKDVAGFVLLDQIRCLDKSRIIKKLGNIEKLRIALIKDALKEMFE